MRCFFSRCTQVRKVTLTSFRIALHTSLIRGDPQRGIPRRWFPTKMISLLQFRRILSHPGPLHMWKFELRRTIRFIRATTPAWAVTYHSGTRSVPAVHLCKSPPCGLPMEAGECLESVRPYTQSLTRRNWGSLTRPWCCGLCSNSPDRNSCFIHGGRASVSALPSVSSASSLSSRLDSSPGCSRPAVARWFALFEFPPSLPPSAPRCGLLLSSAASPSSPSPPTGPPRMLGGASFFARPSGSLQARICPAHMALT